MSDRLFVARIFLMGGALMFVIGLGLWFILHIPAMFPPYLVTALLALGYGAYCFWSGRSAGSGKP